jgi:hypothetical protein
MTPLEISMVVGVLVGVFAALQGWIVSKTVSHSQQLNGLMAPRIAEGAAAVAVVDHAMRGEEATKTTNPKAAAQLADLKERLAALESGNA